MPESPPAPVLSRFCSPQSTSSATVMLSSEGMRAVDMKTSTAPDMSMNVMNVTTPTTTASGSCSPNREHGRVIAIGGAVSASVSPPTKPPPLPPGLEVETPPPGLHLHHLPPRDSEEEDQLPLPGSGCATPASTTPTFFSQQAGLQAPPAESNCSLADIPAICGRLGIKSDDSLLLKFEKKGNNFLQTRKFDPTRPMTKDYLKFLLKSYVKEHNEALREEMSRLDLVQHFLGAIDATEWRQFLDSAKSKKSDLVPDRGGATSSSQEDVSPTQTRKTGCSEASSIPKILSVPNSIGGEQGQSFFKDKGSPTGVLKTSGSSSRVSASLDKKVSFLDLDAEIAGSEFGEEERSAGSLYSVKRSVPFSTSSGSLPPPPPPALGNRSPQAAGSFQASSSSSSAPHTQLLHQHSQSQQQHSRSSCSRSSRQIQNLHGSLQQQQDPHGRHHVGSYHTPQTPYGTPTAATGYNPHYNNSALHAEHAVAAAAAAQAQAQQQAAAAAQAQQHAAALSMAAASAAYNLPIGYNPYHVDPLAAYNDAGVGYNQGGGGGWGRSSGGGRRRGGRFSRGSGLNKGNKDASLTAAGLVSPRKGL